MATTLGGIVRGTPAFEIFAGETAQTRYTHTRQITGFNPATDDESTVKATAGLDQLAAALAVDTSASLKGKRFWQSDVVSSIWYVELEYDSEINASQGGGGGEGGGDPVDLSPEIEYDYETVEYEGQFDAFGKLIATSAGEPFGDTVVLTRPITVLTYSRWQSSFSPVIQQSYMNRINSAPFSGAGQFAVLMSGIRARLRPIAGTKLWWVTYVMKWDPNQWILRKADIGTFHGTAAAPILVNPDSAKGRQALVYMDGQGSPSITGSPETLEFHPHGWADFNQLGL